MRFGTAKLSNLISLNKIGNLTVAIIFLNPAFEYLLNSEKIGVSLKYIFSRAKFLCSIFEIPIFLYQPHRGAMLIEFNLIVHFSVSSIGAICFIQLQWSSAISKLHY